MTNVLGSDQNLVTRIPDRGRTRCQDDVGVQGLVTSLENRPMRPKLINRSHPFLIGRIIGVVGDFRDFAQSVSRRLDAFPAIFCRLATGSSIGSRTGRRNERGSEFITLRFNHLANLRFELGSTPHTFILPIDSDCAKPRCATGDVGIQPIIWEAIWEARTSQSPTTGRRAPSQTMVLAQHPANDQSQPPRAGGLLCMSFRPLWKPIASRSCRRLRSGCLSEN